MCLFCFSPFLLIDASLLQFSFNVTQWPLCSSSPLRLHKDYSQDLVCAACACCFSMPSASCIKSQAFLCLGQCSTWHSLQHTGPTGHPCFWHVTIRSNMAKTGTWCLACHRHVQHGNNMGTWEHGVQHDDIMYSMATSCPTCPHYVQHDNSMPNMLSPCTMWRHLQHVMSNMATACPTWKQHVPHVTIMFNMAIACLACHCHVQHGNSMSNMSLSCPTWQQHNTVMSNMATCPTSYSTWQHHIQYGNSMPSMGTACPTCQQHVQHGNIMSNMSPSCLTSPRTPHYMSIMSPSSHAPCVCMALFVPNIQVQHFTTMSSIISNTSLHV